MCNRSFAEIMKRGQESATSLKGEVAGEEKKNRKARYLFGHLFGMPLAPSSTLLRLIFSYPYFSSSTTSRPAVSVPPSPRCASRLALHLVFLVGFRKVRCSVLVAVLPPFRIRSEGLKPTKLRNRVTQRHPLPRGKHTTRVHARNITQAI